MADHGASAPLLPAAAPNQQHHQQHLSPASAAFPRGPSLPSDAPSDAKPPTVAARHVARHVARLRRAGRRLLDSRKKHFFVMGLVALDAAAVLANVFVRLIACEMHQGLEPWVQALTATLETVALVISCLFVLELAACLLVYGFRNYLSYWFHVFDAAVIVVSFVIEVGLRGLAESIGALVVILRLWRLAKISEEVVIGATERMEILEHHLDELEIENKHLRSQLGLESVEHSGHE